MCFFFNDTATTEIYTLSLHDALPIYEIGAPTLVVVGERDLPDFLVIADTLQQVPNARKVVLPGVGDRKSTRLNSSHANISYAVFCLKKKMNVRAIYITLMYLHGDHII